MLSTHNAAIFSVMSCCKKFLSETPSSRAVICLKWVLPLRLGVLASLAAQLYLYLFILKEGSALLTLFVIIHFVVAITLLKECRRSVDFHGELLKIANAARKMTQKKLTPPFYPFFLLHYE